MLAGAVVLLIYIHFNGDHLIDSDASAELLLADVLNHTHEFLISRHWYYSTEIKVFNSQLIYQIGLLLSPDNWHRARLYSDALFLLIYILSIQFFSGAAMNNRQRWFLCALLFPFGGWYTWNVLFNSFYVPYLAFSFISIGLFLRYIDVRASGDDKEEHANWRKDAILLILLIILSFITGLGGVRQLMICYVPMFLTAILFNIGGFHKTEKKKTNLLTAIVSGSDVRRRMLSGALLSLISAMIGYLLNITVLMKNYEFASYSQQSWGCDFDIGAMINSLNELINMFGWKKEVPIMSLSGINNVLITVIIFIGLTAIIKYVKDYWNTAIGDQSDQSLVQPFVVCFFIFLFLIHWLILSFSAHHTTYWIPVMPFGFAAAAIGIDHWLNDINNQYARRNATVFEYLIFVFSILISSANTLGQPYPGEKAEDDHVHILQVAEWIEKRQFSQGYATFWNSDIITELTDGATEMWTLVGPENLEVFHWLQSSDHSDKVPEQSFFVLLTSDEYISTYGADHAAKEHVEYEDGYYYIMLFDDMRDYEDLSQEVENDRIISENFEQQS